MVATKDFQVLVGMLMSLGCECSKEKAQKLHLEVTGNQETVKLTLKEFALLVNKFIDEECDPVDGVIEAIADQYDNEAKGLIQYKQMIEFME